MVRPERRLPPWWVALLGLPVAVLFGIAMGGVVSLANSVVSNSFHTQVCR